MTAGSRRCPQAAILEQWADVGWPAIEFLEHLLRILAASARENTRAQIIAVGAGQPAVLVQPRTGIACQYFAPHIGVVARRVAAAEDVQEIGRVIARRHWAVAQAVLVERRGFELHDLVRLRRPRGVDPMPRLVDARRRE